MSVDEVSSSILLLAIVFLLKNSSLLCVFGSSIDVEFLAQEASCSPVLKLLPPMWRRRPSNFAATREVVDSSNPVNDTISKELRAQPELSIT